MWLEIGLKKWGQASVNIHGSLKESKEKHLQHVPVMRLSSSCDHFLGFLGTVK